MWAPYWYFVIPYLSISSICWILDMQPIFNEWRVRYCSHEVLKQQYKLIFPTVICNIFILYPILVYLSMDYLHISVGKFDSLKCIAQLLFFLVYFEFSFYVSHRLLHHKKVYHHIHYIHHQLRHTVALGGLYAHPIEFILGNFIPPAIGPLLVSELHYYTMCIWSVALALYVSLSHSGYAGIHLEHHWSYNKFYGTTGYIDYLLGTDKNIVNKE